MEKKKFSVSTILLIIAILVIIIMGCIIFVLFNSNTKSNEEINELKSKTEQTQTTLNNEIEQLQSKIQDMQNILNTNQQNTNTNVPQTNEQIAENVAKNFVKAVNDKNWTEVEKYSSANVVNDLKKYNVTNLTITSSIQANPNSANNYFFNDSYDFNYNGSSNGKDFGLGKCLCVDKVNDTYKVSTFCATAL